MSAYDYISKTRSPNFITILVHDAFRFVSIMYG